MAALTTRAGSRRWTRFLATLAIAATLVAGAPLVGSSLIGTAAAGHPLCDAMGMAEGAGERCNSEYETYFASEDPFADCYTNQEPSCLGVGGGDGEQDEGEGFPPCDFPEGCADDYGFPCNSKESCEAHFGGSGDGDGEFEEPGCDDAPDATFASYCREYWEGDSGSDDDASEDDGESSAGAPSGFSCDGAGDFAQGCESFSTALNQVFDGRADERTPSLILNCRNAPEDYRQDCYEGMAGLTKLLFDLRQAFAGGSEDEDTESDSEDEESDDTEEDAAAEDDGSNSEDEDGSDEGSEGGGPGPWSICVPFEALGFGAECHGYYDTYGAPHFGERPAE